MLVCQSVEVARQRALEINPEIAIQAIHGDLEFDLGIGDVREHDVIIGCLDIVSIEIPMSSLNDGSGSTEIPEMYKATVDLIISTIQVR